MKYYKENPHLAIETRYIIRKYWIFMVPQKLLFFFWEEIFGGMVTLVHFHLFALLVSPMTYINWPNCLFSATLFPPPLGDTPICLHHFSTDLSNSLFCKLILHFELICLPLAALEVYAWLLEDFFLVFSLALLFVTLLTFNCLIFKYYLCLCLLFSNKLAVRNWLALPFT